MKKIVIKTLVVMLLFMSINGAKAAQKQILPVSYHPVNNSSISVAPGIGTIIQIDQSATLKTSKSNRLRQITVRAIATPPAGVWVTIEKNGQPTPFNDQMITGMEKSLSLASGDYDLLIDGNYDQTFTVD